MEKFFNFLQNPTLTTGDAATSFRVSVITNLAQFQEANGEFRATQLETQGSQTTFEGEVCTLFVYKAVEDAGLTLQSIEGLAIALVPLVKKSKIGAIDLSVDIELTPAQLGQLYYNISVVNYVFQNKLLEANKGSFITAINLVGVAAETLQHEDFRFYQVMADNKTMSRDLQNGRVNVINTFTLPEIIQKFVDANPTVKQIKYVGEEVKEQGLNLHYNVGMASRFPPIFINLTYNGNPDSDEYHALVGKGVIFDWGGSDIKTGPFLKWMFLDKGGACAVYGAFKGIVEAGLKVNVTLSIPFAENVIDGDSYRTSDILESHYGPTVEITNTDAEGRLLLADAMSWTQKNFKLNSLIELSTLTGASITALGHEYACIMSNHDCIVDELQNAGLAIREKLWRLPLVDYVRKRLKNGPADIRNSSGSRDAGTIEAGCFLENFADSDVRWIHVDVAATTINYGGTFGPYSVGGTGFGVGFLMEHFRTLSQATAQ